MFNLGVPELILILVIGLVVFGPKKLPEIGKSVGKGLKEFKKAMNDIKKTIDVEAEFKEVTELKNDIKEMADIKGKIIKSVMSETEPTPKASSDNVSDTKSAEDALASEHKDPRLGWVQNSPEWEMPGWTQSTQEQQPEIQTEAGPKDGETTSVEASATQQ